MTNGKQVSLIAHGGKTIIRTLVAVEDAYLYMCKKEEYEKARIEEREPECVGFRVEDLIEA